MISKNEEPMVSINIPTYNEEKDLPSALEAIAKQNYSNIELIIIDSNSQDNTKKIAFQFGAKVLNYDGKLLGARYEGVKESNGEYILFLDADQILKNDSIQNAINKISDYDMLIFEEDSYKPTTYIQKKISEERKLIHKNINESECLNCELLPRFFKKEILEKAFKEIPEKLIPIVVADDHGIICYECYRISENIGILPDAVSHIEIKSIPELLKHFYRFGKSTKKLKKTGFYDEIHKARTDLKKNTPYAFNNNIFLLVVLRSMAYRLGYFFG